MFRGYVGFREVYIHKTALFKVDSCWQMYHPHSPHCVSDLNTSTVSSLRISPGHSRHDKSPHATSSGCSHNRGECLGTAASDWRLKGSEDAPHTARRILASVTKKISTGLTKGANMRNIEKLIIHPCLLRMQTDLGKDLPKESCSL